MAVEFDVSITGFSFGEIDVLLAGPAGDDPDDEDIPAIAATPTTKPGDIWVLERHRVGCRDCRDPGG